MSILKFLGLEEAGTTVESEAVRHLREGLDSLGPNKARYIAAFAHILGRVAGADEQISEEECRVIERVLVEEGGLDARQAALVLDIARNRNLLGDTADYLVTAEFAAIASREQKTQLLNCLFSVAAAENNISEVEQDVIHAIASEIQLPERDFIGVRYRYLKYLPKRAKSTFR